MSEGIHRVIPSALIFCLLFLSTFFITSFSVLANSNEAEKSHQIAMNLGGCGDEEHPLYQSVFQVQGTGLSSPLLKRKVIIEGVVTLALQGASSDKEYRGFWLQQVDDERLSASKASAGIFIYHAKQRVKQGQRLRILGSIAEYRGLTEIKKVQSLLICEHSVKLPKARVLTLPVAALDELERLEGMRIRLSQELVVSDLYGSGYGLGNYGQFAISSRLHFQPTEYLTAKEIELAPSVLTNKQKDYLLIDDGTTGLYPSYIPFPNAKGFSATNSLKVGDKIQKLEGVLHAFDEHYILVPSAPLNIHSVSREEFPLVDKRSNVIIASMNVGNYFNGSPKQFGKPNIGFPAVRGAKSYQGFQLQTQKIVAALTKINADIIGLMEIENDGYGEYSAIADLTRALNENVPEELHYHYLIPNAAKLGGDVISVGILYRKRTAQPIGEAKILSSSNSNGVFDDSLNRPSLLQSFEIKGRELLIAVNHFKSKGRPCGLIEGDELQGSCNQVRKNAAAALIEFIQRQWGKEKDQAVLILGDLNSYSQEDPLLTLYDAGYSNLKSERQFSYSYQGYLGNLDHALANKVLLPKIRSVAAWHINSIQNVLLDYHTESNGHSYPSIDHYGEPNELRSSDHDPIVIGLEL